MDKSSWKKAKEILLILKALPLADRKAYLEKICAGDEGLRRDIDALLAVDLDRVAFLEAPPLRLLHSSPSLEGRMVGAYRILRELGHGGMGTVYLAARADEEFEGQVAIKILRPFHAVPEVEWRFRQEIQILANLNHPNIARLYEAGRTEDESPYFIMEYVDGHPITHFCKERQLSIADRLRLFQKICRAVQYAHQNLIIHRDLKPGNILVDSKGEPKLLDFGVAKLLQPADSSDPATITQLRFFTPDYGSPEQVSASHITTASDVYSLGMLLFELLTERRPYSLEGRTEEEIRRIVCEQEPEPPSTAVARDLRPDSSGEASMGEGAAPNPREDLRKLRRQLQGDLDKIVLMTLRKEPQRRYGSVEQLVGDIEAHLRGFPVSARGDGWGYRTTKFLRRNRLAATITATVLALSLGFGVSLWFQHQRIVRERDKLEQVSALLVDLFEVADPAVARGKKISLVELLRQGTLRIRSELQKQPEVQATLFEKLGYIYIQLGLPEDALKLCEESRGIRENLFGNQDLEVGSALTCLGDAALTQGDFRSAERHLRHALEIARGSTGRQRRDEIIALSNLAWTLHLQNRSSEAEQLLREALDLNTKLPEREPSVLSRLAQIHDSRGEYPEAERLFRQALRLCRSSFGPDHPRVAEAMKYLAMNLGHQGRSDQALRMHRETLDLLRQLYGEEHPKVASAHSDLGLLLLDQEKLDLSVLHLRQAVEIRRKVQQTPTPATAIALSNLGKVLSALGKLEEAEASIREALSIFQETLSEDHIYIAFCLGDLAENLARQRRLGEARETYQEALRVSSATADNRADPFAAALLRNYARFLGRDTGDYEAAAALMQEAIKAFRERLPPGHWYIADAQSYLGSFLLEMGDCQKARPLLLKSYQELRASLGETSPRAQAAAGWLKKLTDCREGRPTLSTPD